MKRLFFLVIMAFQCFALIGIGLAQTEPESKITVRTDGASINAGKKIFLDKCYYCHDPKSTDTVAGPGLKGILKNPVLPVSKRPATPENVAHQMRHPYQGMPLFTFSEDDLLNIIAYLNTL